MGLIETVTVKYKDEDHVPENLRGATANINVEDFKDDLHEKVTAKRGGKKGAAGGVNTDLLLDRVESAESIDDVTQVEMWLSGKGPEYRTPELLQALAEKRLELTTTRERGHVETRVVHPDPVPYEPYLAPASHNKSASRDQGDVFGGADTAEPGFRDPISHAQTEEELDRLAESIQARREALQAAQEQEVADGEGGDSTDKVLEGTVGDVREHVGSVKDEAELDALEKAEKKGSKRSGVLDAIDRRREQLKSEG
jgi:hypothetical protein